MDEQEQSKEEVSPINHDRLFKEIFRKFLKQPNPVAGALMAKMKIAPSDRSKVKLEALKMLTGLGLNDMQKYLVSGFIGTYLKLDPKEQAKFDKGLEKMMPIEHKEEALVIVTNWMERGIEQGIERGKADLVLRQVKQQVGTLTAKEEKQITALTGTQLDELGVALLKFTAKKDLTNWLAQN